jgi:hypothetical protein
MRLGEDASNGGTIARSNGDLSRAGGGILRRNTHQQILGPGRRYRVFEAAAQDTRGMPAKKPVADYFLVSFFLYFSNPMQVSLIVSAVIPYIYFDLFGLFFSFLPLCYDIWCICFV